jgi:RNA polymerase sigma factor (sigma-70 family)
VPPVASREQPAATVARTPASKVHPAALAELDAAMARLADGDRSASDRVFELLWPPLLAFANRALAGSAEAADAAQLALEKVFAQASSYDTSRPALAWALSIVSWECRTLRKKRARRREDALESVTEVAEDVAEKVDLAEALQAAMQALSPDDQAVLKAAFFEEQAQPRAPSFRKQKERALKRLRSLWSKLYV